MSDEDKNRWTLTTDKEKDPGEALSKFMAFLRRNNQRMMVIGVILIVVATMKVGLYNGRVYECKALGGTWFSDGGCGNWTFDPEFQCIKVQNKEFAVEGTDHFAESYNDLHIPSSQKIVPPDKDWRMKVIKFMTK